MFEIKASVIIKKQRIKDMLCGAFEGGSNYWIESVKLIGQRTCEFFHEHPVEEGKEIAIVVSEDYDGKVLPVNLKTIADGLQIMANKYPRHFADLMTENDDAETADVFLQCVVFGDVIFG